MSLMPGRIFSTLSFYIYSEVCSSEEFKKYFATPQRPPLPACFDTRWGKFAPTELDKLKK
jgi:hypothetical protein